MYPLSVCLISCILHVDAYISSLCFPPAGTHEHLLIGLSTGDIKVFSQDLNDGPLFTLREPKSVIDFLHAYMSIKSNIHALI